MNIFRKIFDFLEYRRAWHIARRLKDFLSPGDLVLDMGCGPLVVAEQIELVTGAHCVGVDTLNYRKKPLPMVLYGGGRTPFKDASFDTVVIAFVLHHCDDGGMEVLREAKRLARKWILLLEDSYDNILDRIAIHLVDKFLNRLESPDIKIPYLFRPTWEWKRVFGEMGLALEVMKRMRTTPILKTRQVLFAIHPNTDGSAQGAKSQD